MGRRLLSKRFLSIDYGNNDVYFDPGKILFLDVAWFPANQGKDTDERYVVSVTFEGGIKKELELTETGYQYLKGELELG